MTAGGTAAAQKKAGRPKDAQRAHLNSAIALARNAIDSVLTGSSPSVHVGPAHSIFDLLSVPRVAPSCTTLPRLLKKCGKQLSTWVGGRDARKAQALRAGTLSSLVR